MALPIESHVKVELELHNILGGLGYQIEPAEHGQHRVMFGKTSVLVGHASRIWLWLKITNQYHHPMFNFTKE